MTEQKKNDLFVRITIILTLVFAASGWYAAINTAHSHDLDKAADMSSRVGKMEGSIDAFGRQLQEYKEWQLRIEKKIDDLPQRMNRVRSPRPFPRKNFNDSNGPTSAFFFEPAAHVGVH